MNAVMFNLKFKGSRLYLHGSDIYNAIDGILSRQFGGHLSRLVFKHFAHNQIELLLDKPADMAGMMGNGAWLTAEGRSQQFWIRETDVPVNEAYPFDEDAITSVAEIAGETITGGRSSSYSLIENIIALTKMLNYALSPNVNGKWLFGQIDVKQAFPVDWKKIEIARKIAVGNNFSRNSIAIDGTDYGEIRFIGGNP